MEPVTHTHQVQQPPWADQYYWQNQGFTEAIRKYHEEAPQATKETEGLKYDSGKPRMSLLDSEWLEGVAEVLTFGEKKYAAHNWRKGLSVSRLLDAAARHQAAFNKGEDLDPESGKCHLYHASCCHMFASWMIKHRPDLDDRYKG